MLTNIRKPSAADLNYILDIDLKCFEDNWSLIKWRETVSDPRNGVLIGTYQGLPVGFIVWLSAGKSIVERLGVKASYQNKGVGSQLLSAVEVILTQQGINELIFPVTESRCKPHTPKDVSKWIIGRGYSATGISRNTGWYYGEKEDEIIFHKFLEESSKHGTNSRL
jgi:GNAT superfamily N-acetyltransferase